MHVLAAIVLSLFSSLNMHQIAFVLGLLAAAAAAAAAITGALGMMLPG